jgi:iduronate 2-sulfatase
LLVVAPGASSPGTVVAAPVSLVDLYPTLAELCGLQPPATLQGQSLVPLLRDPGAVGRGWAVTQVVRPGAGAVTGYSLRTPRFRYTEWDEGRRGRELYDHDADPRELRNLADDPAHAADVESLSRALAAAVAGTFPADGKTPALVPGDSRPRLHVGLSIR